MAESEHHAPATTATAADMSAPELPAVDVLSSVRRMLETSRASETPVTDVPVPKQETIPAHPVSEHGAEVREALPHKAPALEQTAPQEHIAVPPPQQSSSHAPSIVADKPAQRVAPARKTQSTHVPLPEKEITIRSIDDLRSLAKELEEAKTKAKSGQH